MNFEPQKFYIGVIEFFSILLPGAVLTYLARNTVGQLALGKEYWKHLHDTETWVIFFFASYLLGHFLYFLGSLLDETLYKWIYECSDDEQINGLMNGKKLAWQPYRLLARQLFRKQDIAQNRVIRIKENYLYWAALQSDATSVLDRSHI